jgi:hypothetical protein
MVLSTDTHFLHNISNSSVFGTEVFEFSVSYLLICFTERRKFAKATIVSGFSKVLFFFAHVQIFESYSTTQC